MRANAPHLPPATRQRRLAGGQEPDLGSFSRDHMEKLARKLALIRHLCLLFYDGNLNFLTAVPEKLILSQWVLF